MSEGKKMLLYNWRKMEKVVTVKKGDVDSREKLVMRL